jgi:hypothetical protein
MAEWVGVLPGATPFPAGQNLFNRAPDQFPGQSAAALAAPKFQDLLIIVRIAVPHMGPERQLHFLGQRCLLGPADPSRTDFRSPGHYLG